MPSRIHAKLLIQQLERAESVVKDLFMEATDDGIEALEAVLAACREEVIKRGPQLRHGVPQSSEDAAPVERLDLVVGTHDAAGGRSTARCDPRRLP